MNVHATAIGIASICYLVASTYDFYHGDYPHAGLWFFYVCANLTMIWYELTK